MSRFRRKKDVGQPYGLYTSLDFGKWEGWLVQAVITRDPDWLWWALEDVDGFRLTPEAEAELEDAS